MLLREILLRCSMISVVRRAAAACTITMRPPPSVLLGTSSASIFQDLEASVNSASTSCPLRNSPCAPLSRTARHSRAVSSSGASARAVTTSGLPHGILRQNPRFACAWTMAGAPVDRARLRAGRRLSSRCSRPDATPFRRRERAGDRPGPESRRRCRDRSSVRASGASREAGANRRRAGSRSSGSSRARSDWSCACHVEQQSDEGIEPRQCFT